MVPSEAGLWWLIGFLCAVAVYGLYKLMGVVVAEFVPSDEDEGGYTSYKAPVDDGYDGWPPNAVKIPEHERWSEPVDAPIKFVKKLPRKRKPAAKKSR